MTDSGPGRVALRRFATNRLAMGCLALLLLLGILAAAGPALLGHDQVQLDWDHVAVAPFDAGALARTTGSVARCWHAASTV